MQLLHMARWLLVDEAIENLAGVEQGTVPMVQTKICAGLQGLKTPFK